MINSRRNSISWLPRWLSSKIRSRSKRIRFRNTWRFSFCNFFLSHRYAPQQLINDLVIFVDQLALLIKFRFLTNSISWSIFGTMIPLRNGTKNGTISLFIGSVSYRMQKRNHNSFPWYHIINKNGTIAFLAF